MTRWTLEEVADCLGRPAHDGEGSVSGVVTQISTDTRTVVPGALYVPLVGERFDGHDFLTEALTKGAAAFVWARPEPPTGPAELSGAVRFQVPDSTFAYQALGRYRRRALDPICIGLTGSVGKTTTKEILARFLGEFGPALASSKNFNNDIGVPLTLLDLRPEHRFAVLEMGMRGRGEIARLADCAEPNVGLITCIGTSHIELLGSRQAIAEAKGELIGALSDDGRAVLPLHDDFFDYLRTCSKAPVWAYSGRPARAGADQSYRVIAPQEVLEADSESSTFRMLDLEWTLPLPGEHHMHDLFAALAILAALDLPLERALEQLSSLTPPEGRGEWHRLGDARVYFDAYNSAPESLRASLAVLAACRGRRLAVLADMLELGDYAEEAHRQIGRELSQYGVEQLFCYGTMARFIAEEARSTGVRTAEFESKDVLADALREALRDGDTVLMKGSRGMALETVLHNLSKATQTS